MSKTITAIPVFFTDFYTWVWKWEINPILDVIILMYTLLLNIRETASELFSELGLSFDPSKFGAIVASIDSGSPSLTPTEWKLSFYQRPGYIVFKMPLSAGSYRQPPQAEILGRICYHNFTPNKTQNSNVGVSNMNFL